MKKSKLLGITAIISITLLLLWEIVFSIFGTLFGFGSGVSIVALLPFLVITTIQVVFLIFLFILSLKILKEQPLPIKENNTTAYALVIIGVAYFLYSFVNVLSANITGFNPGGWAQPVLTFLWCLILVSFGLTLKEKNKSV